MLEARRGFDRRSVVDVDAVVGTDLDPASTDDFRHLIARALKPGGLAAIQVITLPDARYEDYCSSHSDFIRTYIFPGGHCPSLCCMNGLASQLGLAPAAAGPASPERHQGDCWQHRRPREMRHRSHHH